MKKSLIFWSISLAALTGLIVFYFKTNFVSSPDTRLMEIAAVGGNAEATDRFQEVFTAKIPQTPILFWGVFPEDADGMEILRLFLAKQKFDEVWVDGPWQQQLEGRQVYLRKNEVLVRQELKKVLAENKRILIVSSPIDVNSSLEGSVAFNLDAFDDLDFVSVSVSGFPRRREQEAQMKVPCILPHADQTGTGALGCQILNIARSVYRQRFAAGSPLMLIEQISPKDFILLMSTELAL